MGCLNGTRHAHGCKLSTSKSVQIIEDSLLNFIRGNLLTEAVVEGVFKKTNAFFEQEARKPRIDTAPLKAEARKLKGNIKKYQTFIEDEPDEDLCRSHNARVKELQARLNEVQAKIRDAERQNRKPPKPLKLERGKLFVPDLRELLNGEVAMVAEVIRSLTGAIEIRQEETPGKRGARWIATFSADVVALLRRVAREKDYPDARSLTAAPADPQPVDVVIEKVPKYERLAPVFKRMRDNGASVQSVAAAHGMSWRDASEILHFAETGERPKWRAGNATGTGVKPAKYFQISKEVSYLRDKKKRSFPQIAARLCVSVSTARRAYDHEHRQAIREAAERGETPCRGQYSHLGEDAYEEIRNLLRAGSKPSEIAAKVGCGASTVYRERRRMRAETGEDQAA